MSHHADRSFGCHKVMLQSEYCGCYYCGKVYDPEEIEEWVQDHSGKTPICPHCGIDSVVPYNSKLDGTLDNFGKLLKEWHKESFE